jgi:hypothetical protein
MNEYSPFRLSQSLRAASQTIPKDPFAIDLPPAFGAGSGVDPSTLATLGSMYLQAALEQAGVIPAAEALVDARASLDMPTERVAELLEKFARRARNWYDRDSRNRLFAREFGVGPAATTGGTSLTNHDFEQRLGALCTTLNRYAADEISGQASPPADDAQIRQSANDLLSNLEMRQFGNTLFAARLIQEELEASIELLKSPEIGALFHVQGFWPTVERILEPDVPDVARLVERGQAGQHLLAWLGTTLGALGTGTGALVPPNSPVFQWAASWLGASGVTGTPTRERRVA